MTRTVSGASDSQDNAALFSRFFFWILYKTGEATEYCGRVLAQGKFVVLRQVKTTCEK